MRQLVLDLPHRPGFDREDFLPGASNEAALGLMEGWPAWPDTILLLHGPPGSGKSHLASIWAARSGAFTLAASDVREDVVPTLAAMPALAVEDLGRGRLDEPALFHLVNLSRESGRSMLLTAAGPVDALGIGTADLASRLRLAPAVALGPPDDALLKAVLVKLFLDRQLLVDASVVDYLATHIERSLGRASAVVAALDREALSRGRRVTRPMAADLVAGSEAGDHRS